MTLTLSPIVIAGALGAVVILTVLVTLALTRRGAAEDDAYRPLEGLKPPGGVGSPAAQELAAKLRALPNMPQAPASAKGGPPPAPARKGDLLALAETTLPLHLKPEQLAQGPAEPLPGMKNAYDRIAKGEIHAHLQVIAGPARGRAAELGRKGKVTAGRGAGNQIDLKDAGASIDQCAFESDGSEVVVRDLGSRNGTFVNGDKVKDVRRLANCDIVACGESRILVTTDSAPAGGMTE